MGNVKPTAWDRALDRVEERCRELPGIAAVAAVVGALVYVGSTYGAWVAILAGIVIVIGIGNIEILALLILAPVLIALVWGLVWLLGTTPVHIGAGGVLLAVAVFGIMLPLYQSRHAAERLALEKRIEQLERERRR